MKKILFAAFFIFLLIATVSVHPAQATMLAASTRTPTPRFKSTPTRTPLPSLLTILPDQLDWGLGGGGYPFDKCRDKLSKYKGGFPVVFFGEHDQWYEEVGSICIAGLEMKGKLQISLSTTTGKNLGNAVFRAEGQFSWDGQFYGKDLHKISPTNVYDGGVVLQDENKLTILIVDVWLPPDFPYAQLRIDARNDAGSVSAVSNSAWDNNYPYLYIPSNNINPFNDPPQEYNLKPGQELRMGGVNYPRSRSLPFGVYRSLRYSVNGKELQDSNWIQSDSQGRVSITLRFDSNDPPGDYDLAVFSSPPDVNKGEFIGVYVDTCSGAPASSLSLGDKIKINPQIPKPNNIRSQAGKKNNLLGKLEINQTAVVIDGWRCVDQMVWWKIRTSTGLEGWTSEGQGNEQWLIPIP